ncbi:MAG: M23 family metallopeptidase [Bacteroidales bacterium]
MHARNKNILTFLIIFSTIANVYTQELFKPPVNIPVFLSANFAELRADHFHSGIDIKTQGVAGIKVVAAADGYVYQIVVSPTGFGKALYLRHPSGYSTVYAHLDSFTPEIDEYVKKQQYHNKSYSVTINPPKERFVFKQGELIGFSGNTGSSSGPHLHFEVRKSDKEKPVNPLIFNFGVEDNLAPLIERLIVYPATKSTLINGSNKKLTLSTAGRSGSFTLAENIKIVVRGTAGFGISCRDRMNNTSNRFGINFIELSIDSIPWFTCDFNEFSFSETRYINAHIDYEEMVRNNIWIHRTFVLPNNKLGLYRNYMNNGFFDFSDGKTHYVKITVRDANGNESLLNFNVKSEQQVETDIERIQPAESEKKVIQSVENEIIIMPYGKSNMFKADGIIINIPKYALYDTLYFRYSTEKNSGMLSPVHRVHNRFTPVHRAYSLSIRPNSIPSADPSKLLIVRIDEKQKLNYVGGNYSNGYVTASVTQFGDYAIAIDTVPPVITPDGFSQNADLSLLKEIRIKITDNLSGIKNYTGIIDDNWALFEYDPKRDLIFYRFDQEKISKGIKHTLKLTVTDYCDNSSVLETDFYW